VSVVLLDERLDELQVVGASRPVATGWDAVDAILAVVAVVAVDAVLALLAVDAVLAIFAVLALLALTSPCTTVTTCGQLSGRVGVGLGLGIGVLNNDCNRSLFLFGSCTRGGGTPMDLFDLDLFDLRRSGVGVASTLGGSWYVLLGCSVRSFPRRALARTFEAAHRVSSNSSGVLVGSGSALSIITDRRTGDAPGDMLGTSFSTSR
jgi:hypothetical protein